MRNALATGALTVAAYVAASAVAAFVLFFPAFVPRDSPENLTNTGSLWLYTTFYVGALALPGFLLGRFALWATRATSLRWFALAGALNPAGLLISVMSGSWVMLTQTMAAGALAGLAYWAMARPVLVARVVA